MLQFQRCINRKVGKTYETHLKTCVLSPTHTSNSLHTLTSHVHFHSENKVRVDNTAAPKKGTQAADRTGSTVESFLYSVAQNFALLCTGNN